MRAILVAAVLVIASMARADMVLTVGQTAVVQVQAWAGPAQVKPEAVGCSIVGWSVGAPRVINVGPDDENGACIVSAVNPGRVSVRPCVRDSRVPHSATTTVGELCGDPVPVTVGAATITSVKTLQSGPTPAAK